jgi:membrane-associated protein
VKGVPFFHLSQTAVGLSNSEVPVAWPAVLHLAPATLVAALDFLDPEKVLVAVGTIGLIAVIFAESGLLFGFFLPGDSLLFTAGLFAAEGKLNLAVILLGCFAAAVLGDQVGYAFGNRVGPALFRRPDSRFFKKEHVEKAQGYFDKYGAKTIVLARFVPIVRTFAPIVAGVGTMRYRTFLTFNLAGGLLWTFGVTLLGYFLGNVAWIHEHLEIAILGIVFLSILPIVYEAIKARRTASSNART